MKFPGLGCHVLKIDEKGLLFSPGTAFRRIPNLSTSAPRNQQHQTAIPA
jgi:hypothetical protein